MPLQYFFPRIPDDMVTNPYVEDFRRLKTQNLSISEQYIVSGIGYSTNWIELDIAAASGREFATFDVPAGFYMALNFRLVNTSGENMWYHVYPEGTYTVDTVLPDVEATGKVQTRNLRQDAPAIDPINRVTLSVLPTRLIDSIIDQPEWGQAASSSGNKSAGNTAPDDTFLLLNPDQQFLLEIYNGGAGAQDAQVLLNYALIPVSGIPEL